MSETKTLRELAQAVVDAGPTEHVWPVNAPTSAMLKALMPEVGGGTSPLYDTARAILAADAAAEARGREAGRREARDVAQRELDEIVSILDMCSWGDDEAWQIQCHMDSLVEIINAAGGSAERVLFATFRDAEVTP